MIGKTAHLKSLKRISDLYISFVQTLFSFVFGSDFNASNSTTAKKKKYYVDQSATVDQIPNKSTSSVWNFWAEAQSETSLAVMKKEKQLYSQAILHTAENCLAKLLQNCLAWRQNVNMCQFRLFSSLA